MNHDPHQQSLDPKVRKDLRTLARFIEIYCDGKHKDAERAPVALKSHRIDEVLGRTLVLCVDCEKLLAHAFVKRSLCPMEPKPACKDCPQHCYHPQYREQIRAVMRYSGWRSVFKGRLDYILHLLKPSRAE